MDCPEYAADAPLAADPCTSWKSRMGWKNRLPAGAGKESLRPGGEEMKGCAPRDGRGRRHRSPGPASTFTTYSHMYTILPWTISVSTFCFCARRTRTCQRAISGRALYHCTYAYNLARRARSTPDHAYTRCGRMAGMTDSVRKLSFSPRGPACRLRARGRCTALQLLLRRPDRPGWGSEPDASCTSLQ